LRKFALAWLLMWAFAYVAVAIIAPGISGEDSQGRTIYLVSRGRTIYLAMGVAVIGTLALLERGTHKQTKMLAKILLLALAIIEVFSGIASWSGVAVWNVPFANKELFQVSMAFADLISAAFMFYLILQSE